MAKNSPKKEKSQDSQARIERALKLAVKYGGIDGDHHKAWVIDQMVRELTGCPTVRRMSPCSWADGRKHRTSGLGESKEYLELVRKAREGEDGPESLIGILGSLHKLNLRPSVLLREVLGETSFSF